MLIETEEVYREWKRLIVKYQVSGVQVHDARIVAAMIVHGISRLLTFNEEDFARYADIIQVVQPKGGGPILPPKPQD